MVYPQAYFESTWQAPEFLRGYKNRLINIRRARLLRVRHSPSRVITCRTKQWLTAVLKAFVEQTNFSLLFWDSIFMQCVCMLRKVRFEWSTYGGSKGFFTTIATNLAIWLANLPLSIKVQTTYADRVNVSRSSSRPEKNIFFDVDIVVKKQIERGLALSLLLSTTLCVILVG